MTGWSATDLLPALWLVVLAFLIDRGIRRWEVRMPAAGWTLAGAMVAALLAPALVTGRVLASAQKLTAFPPFLGSGAAAGAGNPLHGDLLFQVIPWRAAVRRFLFAGEWPLWNPWSGAGVPLLANPSAQALHPLAVLGLPLALAQRPAVEAGLRVLVAVVFMFLLLRHQGAGRPASLFGAAAFGSSGFLVLYLGWPLASSAALLPLAVYATVRWMDEGGRVTWVVLALALAAVLTAGHPDTILWVLLVAGLFAVSRTIPPRVPARRFVGWSAALVVAAALAAPVLVPTAFELPRSHRAAVTASRESRLEAGFARSGPWQGRSPREALAESARRLLPVAAPSSFGNNRFGAFWGEERNVNAASGGFAGSAALLGAVLALACLLGRRRAPGLAGERPAAGLVLVAAVLTAKLPAVPLLLAQIPGLDRSAGFHRRSHMVLAFGIAYLGAAAVERWRRGSLPPARVIAAALALAALVAWGYLAHPFPADPSALRTLRMGSLALHLGVLAVAAGLLASRRLGRARWAALVLVVVQAAELLILHAPANPTAPASLFYPRTPALEFLAEEADGERIVGLGNSLRANVASVYGIADARTNDPSKPWKIQRLLDPVLPRPGRFAIADAVVRPDHPVLDLLGVHYVLVEPRRELPGLERAFAGDDASVWARPAPLDRLFLPTSAVVLAGEDAPGGGDPGPEWWRWTAANPDFAARSLVEPSPGHLDPWRAERPSGAWLGVESAEPTRWSARALLPEERLLASGIYQDGGWRVLVDGLSTPTVTTNGALVGAWLPAGEHRLELIYRPPGFLAGCLLAALALAVLAAVAVPPPATIELRSGEEAARLDACA